MTKAQGQLITKNVNALEIHSLQFASIFKNNREITGGKKAKATAP